ncbi:MAG: TonB-dependent receptor [Bacteroidetes bacterium]|nr:TonB-dependent receptor [Bacteroidota bacterium]
MKVPRKFIVTEFLFVILVLISLQMPAFSQTPGTLRGVITDSTSGEPLPYANVFIEDLLTGTSTDAHGHFLVSNIPGGRSYWLTVSYMGYSSKKIEFLISKNKITHVDIELSASAIEISEIEKTGILVEQQQESVMSLTKITALELDRLPHGAEKDVIRSLKYLTGVQSFGDNSAKYFVRGSSSDQTQVLFNNAVIYYPFHAMNLIGVIDNNVIRSVEFQKGGFSAEHGDRLGGLLKINTRDGNTNNFSITGEAGLLSGKLLFEGPIPHGSFYIAGRKSFSNNTLSKYMNGNDVPADFYDGSFKLHYADDDFWKNARFTLYGFTSDDKIEYEKPGLPSYKWSNSLMGIKYFQYAEELPLYAEIEFSESKAKGELLPDSTKYRYRINEIRDMTFQTNVKYIFDSTDELNIGFRIKDISTTLPVESSESFGSNLSSKGMGMCVFANWKLLRFKSIGANLGVRANLTRIAGASPKYLPLEPRMDFSYLLDDGVKLKLAWGIYYQDLITLVDDNAASSAFDPWIILPTYFDPLRAIHYIIGSELNFSSALSFNIEGYYKSISNQPFLNENRTSPVQYQILSGSSEAYGLEIEGLYQIEDLKLKTNYSLSWVFKKREGERYVPNYDSRHSLNMILDYDFGNEWIASLVWSFSSGKPYTQILASYDMLLLNSMNDIEYGLTDKFEHNKIMGEKNAHRLPAYHRLDISISKRLKFYSFDINWDVSVTNLYDRKNIFYLDYYSLETYYSLPFMITTNLRVKI